MRTILKPRRTKRWNEVLSEKRGRQPLVACFINPNPNKMPMIGHQNVARAGDLIAAGRVKKDFAKMCVERFAQPPGRAVLNRVRPQDTSAALIELTSQAR